MPFARTWSLELRAAMMRAILDRGMSATRALELATAGNLEPGLAAAAPPIGTVRDWAREERRRRGALSAAADGPGAMLTGYAGRLAALLDRETLRLERKHSGPLDVKRVAELGRAGRELAALARAISAETPAAAPGPVGSPNGAAAGGFLEGLAAQSPDTSQSS